MEANPRRGRARPDGSRGLPEVGRGKGRGTLVLVATAASIAASNYYQLRGGRCVALRYVQVQQIRFALVGLLQTGVAVALVLTHVFLPSGFLSCATCHVSFHQTVPHYSYQSVIALSDPD